MKEKNCKLNKILLGIAVLLAVCAVVLSFVEIPFSKDGQTQALLNAGVTRFFAGIAAVLTIIITGGTEALKIKKEGLFKNLIWCLPCLLVALANFPFTALISGAAKIERYDLIPLLIFYCFSIALMEEAVFRGIIHQAISEKLKGRAFCDAKAVIISSAVFALWHLFNLFEGASVPLTFLQVGYTFLTGAMFASALIKTGNLWISVLLHAIFDFGGFIVTELGTGSGWDLGFWILTAICGLICAVHVCCYLLKNKKSPQDDGD